MRTEFRTNFRYPASSLVNALSLRIPCPWIFEIVADFKFSYNPENSLSRPDEVSFDRVSEIGQFDSNFPRSYTDQLTLSMYLRTVFALIRYDFSKARWASSLIALKSEKLSRKLYESNRSEI